MPDNIFPIYDQLLQKEDKERFLKQHAKVLWFTGLSGSGKSTIAKEIEKALFQKGYLAHVLDGDNIRTGINSNLGFSEEDRIENIRRISEISKIMTDAGVITLSCFISPTIAIRKMAKKIIGEDRFVEVYVNASFEECAKRDVKGLYEKALNGEIKNFTGLDSPFEAPLSPDIELKTADESVEQTIEKALAFILPLIKHEL